MKRKLLILIGATLTLAAQAQQVARVTEQVDLGTVTPFDSVSFYIEYPEYQPLRATEIAALRKQGFAPSATPQFETLYSLSRGKTLADVSFVPIVQRNGRWLRLVRYELRHRVTSRYAPAIHTLLTSAQRVAQATRYASQSVLAEGKWVKIRVSKEGIYQLTDAQLAKMGFSDPSRVKLYGYGGRLLPDAFTFEGNGALIDDLCEVPLYRRQGSVLFWAEGLTRWKSDGNYETNTFSSYSYYFLTEGDSPAAWSQADEPTGTPADVNECVANALLDNDAYVWYGGGRDFYDNNELLGGHSFTLALPGNTGAACTVRYDVSAMSTTASSRYTITRTTGGQTEEVAQGNIAQTGENESAKGTRGSFQAQLGESERFNVSTTVPGRLNYIYARYTQHLSTAYTTGAFTTTQSGPASLHVAAADANTRVWQVNDNGVMVQELPGQLDGTTYTVRATSGQARFVIADISSTAYKSPEVVGTVENQNLHADGPADYIIIVPASGKLVEQAERLAAAHQEKSGLRTRIVRADQLFNEFSSGTPDAAAYRRYLKMLYDRATTDADRPRYLLLMGNCSYDNRMITSEWRSASPDDYLLAFERNDQERVYNGGYSIGTLHSYVTDDYFALLDDGEGAQFSSSTGTINEKPDIAVGRFICTTPTEAKWLVDQAIAYMNNDETGAWKNRMWAMGDFGDNNLHMEDADGVVKQAREAAGDNFLIRRINPDVYAPTPTSKGTTYPEATAKILQAMQQGALIFNYNGHGSPDRLSHAFLLSKEEMAANVSKSRPVWVFASCEITPYDQAVTDLGRNALFNENAPAVAVVCAARTVYADRNRALNEGFIKYAFVRDSEGRCNTLGEALRLSKCELVASSSDGNTIGVDRTINKLKYVLLGDPALHLACPQSGVVIDSINGQPIEATATSLTQLPIGSKVRFSGYVGADGATSTSPDTNFNGVLTATVFTPLQTLTCKGNANTSADPFVYQDYTRTLFEGSVEVKQGRFTVEFVVPRGITFSTDEALLSLYAVDNTTRSERNGAYKRFCFNGVAATAEPDTVPPALYLYLDTPDFPDGGIVSTSATFYAALSDSTALSIVSGNLGHDMELWFDGDASTTQVLNDYFAFSYGSYSEGLVTYPLSGLTPGRHTLTFRAWDAFDNSAMSTLSFVVREGGASNFEVNATRTADQTTRFVTSLAEAAAADTEVRTEVYSISGVRIWHGTTKVTAGNRLTAIDWAQTDYAGRPLPPGVYLYRSVEGKQKTSAKKLVVH